jgi:F420-0:gamma-glutamyl ligase-like protein
LQALLLVLKAASTVQPPYSYVSFAAQKCLRVGTADTPQIRHRLGKSVCVIIADTDKTYRFHNFYFTPRPNPLKGIHSGGGVFVYVLGRVLGFKRSSTPLAVAGQTSPQPQP